MNRTAPSAPSDLLATVLAPREGKVLLVIGERITLKLTGEDTDGAFALFEDVTPVGGGPAFLHTHPPQETICVIEGEIDVYTLRHGEKVTAHATAGTVVHIPANAPHGFRNVGAVPARTLQIVQPAGNLEVFFQEFGIPLDATGRPVVPPGSPDFEKLLAMATKYGMAFLEPLPGTGH